MEKRTTTELERFQGCLMGVAIGDALGMPVETMKHEDIMALNGGRGVVGFMAPVQKRIWDTANLAAGDTTDDWQLTRAVARSLIRTGGPVELKVCAEEHVIELGRSKFGWGRASQSAIQDIADGRRNMLYPLPPPEPGKGCGNGVVMKIAPVALVSGCEHDKDMALELWRECRLLGSLTHPDIRASLAAYAVALLMAYLKVRVEKTGKEVGPDETADVLRNWILPCLRDKERMIMSGPETVSERLEKVSGSIDSADGLRLATGCKYNALDTAAFSIGTFMRHPLDFRAGVLEAVNAGFDTDTNASVVGALIGLNCGIQAIPGEWRGFNPAFAEAYELAEGLYRL